MAAAGVKWPGVADVSRLATLRLAILACAVLLFAAAALGAEKSGAKAVDAVPAGAAAARGLAAGWIVGDKYTVNVTCGGVQQSYEGKLLKVSDHWIVLRDYGIAMAAPVISHFRTVPMIGYWIRRSEKPAEVERWIPRDALTIVSRRPALKPVTIDEPLGNEPPINRGGRIELLRDGKVVSPQSDLTAINDGNLTLKTDDAAGSRRERVARRDIFCISWYSRCLNPDEAE